LYYNPALILGDNRDYINSVIIPNNVTSLGERAFFDCDNLTSVTFQGKITEANFAVSAFYGLGNLREMYLENGQTTYARQKGSKEWYVQGIGS